MLLVTSNDGLAHIFVLHSVPNHLTWSLIFLGNKTKSAIGVLTAYKQQWLVPKKKKGSSLGLNPRPPNN